MHGGAAGAGAPIGNANAEKHGMFRREAIEERRALRRLMQKAKAVLEEITS